MKKLIMLAALGLVASACNDLEGQLRTSQTLEMVNKKGKTILVPPGLIQMKVQVDNGDKEIELKLKINGKDEKVKLKVPAGRPLPTYSGQIELLGREVGQKFDLIGIVDTDVYEGSRIRTTESCTYYEREHVCRNYDERDSLGNIHRVQRCGYEDVVRTGRQDVEYHNKTTTTTGKVTFLDSASRSEIGQFNGSNSISETIYDYRGYCDRFGFGGGFNRF